MSAVPTAPAPSRNTWTCPTCRHGSPDPRDELAHLDAHRQLSRFFDEWDDAVVADRNKERDRRSSPLVVAGLAVLVVLVAGAVFWSFHRSGGQSGPVAGSIIPTPRSIPTPTPAPASGLTPQGPTAPDASQLTPPAPQQVSLPSPARTAPVVAPAAPAAVPAAVTSPPPAPSPPVPAGTGSPKFGYVGFPAPAPTYLLQVCVLGTCLTIP